MSEEVCGDAFVIISSNSQDSGADTTPQGSNFAENLISVLGTLTHAHPPRHLEDQNIVPILESKSESKLEIGLTQPIQQYTTSLQELNSSVKKREWRAAEEYLINKFKPEEKRSASYTGEYAENYTQFLIEFVKNMGNKDVFFYHMQLIDRMLKIDCFRNSIYGQDSSQQYPVLNAAVSLGQTQLLDKLLCDMHDDYKNYLFIQAVKTNKQDIVAHLFSKINQQTIKEVLIIAAENKRFAMFTFLLNKLDLNRDHMILSEQLTAMPTVNNINNVEKNKFLVLILKKMSNLTFDEEDYTGHVSTSAFDFALQQLTRLSESDRDKYAWQDKIFMTLFAECLIVQQNSLQEDKDVIDQKLKMFLSKGLAAAAQLPNIPDGSNQGIFGKILNVISQIQQNENKRTNGSRDALQPNLAESIKADQIEYILHELKHVSINKLTLTHAYQQNRLSLIKQQLEQELAEYWDNRVTVKHLTAIVKAFADMEKLLVMQEAKSSQTRPTPDAIKEAYNKILEKCEFLPNVQERTKWKKRAAYWLLPSLLCVPGLLFAVEPHLSAYLIAMSGYTLMTSISYVLVPIYSFLLGVLPIAKYYLEKEKLLEDSLVRNATQLYHSTLA